MQDPNVRIHALRAGKVAAFLLGDGKSFLATEFPIIGKNRQEVLDGLKRHMDNVASYARKSLGEHELHVTHRGDSIEDSIQDADGAFVGVFSVTAGASMALSA